MSFVSSLPAKAPKKTAGIVRAVVDRKHQSSNERAAHRGQSRRSQIPNLATSIMGPAENASDAINSAELARGVGMGGRGRRAGAAAERARVNVQRRIRGAIRKLGDSLPELATYLDRTVKTGTFCSYESM